jgi:hypothetical protein
MLRISTGIKGGHRYPLHRPYLLLRLHHLPGWGQPPSPGSTTSSTIGTGIQRISTGMAGRRRRLPGHKSVRLISFFPHP